MKNTREFCIGLLIIFTVFLASISFGANLDPQDFNGQWKINIAGSIRVYEWEGGPSYLKVVEIAQVCNLELYYKDAAFHVYHLYCEDENSQTIGWWQYGTDGKYSSGLFSLEKYNNDGSYQPAECFIGKVRQKTMRGRATYHDNDYEYYGWGTGECLMRKVKE